MIVGLDFDNTIVCYERVFHAAALDLGLLSSPLADGTKDAVRDHLRRDGREDAWTELQGFVYGTRMHLAEPYPGFPEFLHTCRELGARVLVISHKTQFPYRGPAYDLHAAAKTWLLARREDGNWGLHEDDIFFEPTKDDKLRRISSCNCALFVDDLPELLLLPAFPPGVSRILFDPHNQHSDDPRLTRVPSWRQAAAVMRAIVAGK